MWYRINLNEWKEDGVMIYIDESTKTYYVEVMAQPMRSVWMNTVFYDIYITANALNGDVHSKR